jgi:cobalamin biosynthesis protein CbiG
MAFECLKSYLEPLFPIVIAIKHYANRLIELLEGLWGFNRLGMALDQLLNTFAVFKVL